VKICIWDLGFQARWVEDDYVPVEGEKVFDDFLTEEGLVAAFPGRAERIADMEVQRIASIARADRDARMRNIYDAGTQMIRRELETLPLDPVYEAKLIAKRDELHAYARLLQAVPDQTGFPDVIAWPTPPTEELE
jgi:hypothetical protein